MPKKISGISVRYFKRLVSQSINNVSAAVPVDPNVSYSNAIEANIETADNRESKNVETEKITFAEDFSNWCVERRISRNATKDFLALHISHGIDVPKSVKTLMKTGKTVINIVKMPHGEYFHYGIDNALQVLSPYLTEAKIILVDVGIDELPIFKSSSTTLWPILGSLP